MVVGEIVAQKKQKNSIEFEICGARLQSRSTRTLTQHAYNLYSTCATHHRIHLRFYFLCPCDAMGDHVLGDVMVDLFIWPR